MNRKKPGPDNRSDRQRADDLMAEADEALGRPRVATADEPARDERQLFIRYQSSGDIDARNDLVVRHRPLVHWTINRYFRGAIRSLGADPEDAIQEGVEGLLRAVKTFDVDRGIKFSTYGCYWIRARIQRLLDRQRRHNVFDRIEESEDEDGGFEVRDPGSTPLELVTARAVAHLAAELADGDDLEVMILRHRLLTDDPETLNQVGGRVGRSREWARQKEVALIQRVRECA